MTYIHVIAQKIYISIEKEKLNGEQCIKRRGNASLLEEHRTYVGVIVALLRANHYSILYIAGYSCTKNRNAIHFIPLIALRVITPSHLLKRMCMTWLKSDLTCYIFFWHLVIFSHIMIVQEIAREIYSQGQTRNKSALINRIYYVLDKLKKVGYYNRIQKKKEQREGYVTASHTFCRQLWKIQDW